MIWLILAAFIAGAINAIAGGGTLFTFPALLAVGIAPVAANATSTVALVPGSLSSWWTYRSEIEDARADIRWLTPPSLVGGLVGAVLAMRAGDRLFGELVPWLILGATVLFIVNEPLRRWLTRRGDAKVTQPRLAVAIAGHFVASVYGGFFGAGMGIMMLAVMALMGLTNIHRMNGLKSFAAVWVNGIASVAFAVAGQVRWTIALTMAIAAIVGGTVGARLARRIGPRPVRLIVIAVGFLIGAQQLWQRWSG